jgi:hypothetical protein
MNVPSHDASIESDVDHHLHPIFELGGPAYRLMQRVGIIQGSGPSIGRRIVFFIFLTWVPILFLTAIEGNALGATPRTSFLLDFVEYARFFITIPLIFAAEIIVGPRILAAGRRFVRSGILAVDDFPAFRDAALRARARRDAASPEIMFLAVSLFLALFLVLAPLAKPSAATWSTAIVNGQTHLTLAGLWHRFVAIPLVQFFLLRWVWRVVIWTLFLRQITGLRLKLVATHSDRAAGLGFLGVTHVRMALFPFGLSCIVVAELAFRVQFEGLTTAGLASMAPLLIVYLLFVELVVFGSLLVVVPLLARVRREGERLYGTLVQRHNWLFHEKWIENSKSSEEAPLGNPDMSSLVDLGGSFDVVREMRLIPVGRKQLVQVAVIVCLPGLPLAFLVLPVMQIVKMLVAAVV